MAQHFVAVCVVCVLCAAHRLCFAHMVDSSQVVQQTTPSVKYSTELPGYSEHLLPHRINSTEVPAWKDVHKKDSKRNENHKRFNKVPDQRTEKSHYDDRLAEDLEHIRTHQEARQKELLERLGQNDLESPKKNSKVNQTNDKNLRSKRSSDLDEKYFTKKIFELYGDGENMTIEGFERLLKKMGLFQSESIVSEEEIHSIDSNQSGSRLGK